MKRFGGGCLAIVAFGALGACLGTGEPPALQQSSPNPSADASTSGTSSSGASSGASLGSGSNSNLVDGGSADGGSPSTNASCTAGASFAPARLSLISDDQYRNIIHDVFHVTIPASFEITTLPSTSGSYPYNENAQVQTTTVQAYLRAADQVASQMTSFPPCTGTAVNATCMQAFLAAQLPLAWRRPVSATEISGLLTIFNSAAMDGATRQIQLTMEAALIHPAFLYRSELGTNAAAMPTGKVSLTPYELASAVSFAMLNSSPDQELWAKAQDGSIAQPAVLAAEVSRLLALPPVRANLTKKASYYLDFEALLFASKDATAYPNFAMLQPILYQSSQLFLNDVLWGGHFSDLFSTRRIYTNAAMSAAYGLPAVTGTQLQAVTPSGDAYGAGLLTQPALLAASNRNAVGDDVVHRGLWVYYNLLCAPPVPPPPAGAFAAAAAMMGSTYQIAQQRDTGCGAACHSRFDPFGIATLKYDGIGRYRTSDPTSTPPGAPVNDVAYVPAGVLPGVAANASIMFGSSSAPAVQVNGVADVARLFASGRQVSDCAADVLATYMLDHSPDKEGSCELQSVKDRFQQSQSFADLFTSILTSAAFLTRDIESP